MTVGRRSLIDPDCTQAERSRIRNTHAKSSSCRRPVLIFLFIVLSSSGKLIQSDCTQSFKREILIGVNGIWKNSDGPANLPLGFTINHEGNQCLIRFQPFTAPIFKAASLIALPGCMRRDECEYNFGSHCDPKYAKSRYLTLLYTLVTVEMEVPHAQTNRLCASLSFPFQFDDMAGYLVGFDRATDSRCLYFK